MRFIDRSPRFCKRSWQRENSWLREKVERESRGRMEIHSEIEFSLLASDSKVIMVETKTGKSFVAVICSSEIEAKIKCAALNWLLTDKVEKSAIANEAERGGQE